ncbi:hypothetical protein [Candidatus Phyllobacterium onerii]|uniref:hypothetical protein n=1 Tax=Candidatus Phyllobacterium onerii TaxID=3020828 RepID=UPI00232BF494|nr:hypothetical protein [Phyllobacterium sp. IY22]
MSLHLFEKLTYSEDDWDIMQDAHLKACEFLGHDPVFYKNADRLARTIMNLFDGGARDFQIIASIAAHREAMLDRQLATYH